MHKKKKRNADAQRSHNIETYEQKNKHKYNHKK